MTAFPVALCSMALSSRVAWFVSSLQVLASVKKQIEEVAARQKDFPELLLAAQQCLLARESSLPVQGSSLPLFTLVNLQGLGLPLFTTFSSLSINFTDKADNIESFEAIV